MAWLNRWRWFLFPKATQSPLKAVFDQTGITQLTGLATVHIDWHEVTHIYAYKKDCFAVDQLRMEIVATGKNILCTEDEQSFEEIELAIKVNLPASLPNWHQTLVSSPAFALTWIQVYPILSQVI